jgi:RNA polymerase sigma-70 factor (ECF subfamily)
MTAPPSELADLCAREYPRLVGSLTLLVGDREVALDLAQEALARLCRDWERVRVMEAPGAWLHRVGVNLARSRFRRVAAELRANGRVSAQPVAIDVALEGTADRMAVRAALAALPRRQREAVVLHYYLGHTVLDVAALLDVREGTVKSALHRARATLRERLRTREAAVPA